MDENENAIKNNINNQVDIDIPFDEINSYKFKEKCEHFINFLNKEELEKYEIIEFIYKLLENN